MATTGAAKAKQAILPRSATITIRDHKPSPGDRIEVAPGIGRVHFQNKDKKEYRLRFWKPDTEPLAGIDILLPARARVTVMIKKKDEFLYGVLHVDSDAVFTGHGGGPITN